MNPKTLPHTRLYSQVALTCVLVVLPADDLSSQDQFEVPEAGGWDATLSGEDEDDFFDLQIVKHYDGEVRMDLCMVVFYRNSRAQFFRHQHHGHTSWKKGHIAIVEINIYIQDMQYNKASSRFSIPV